MIMFKSFFNWKVGVNILIVVCLFVGGIWGTFRWLEYHTNHGKEVPVPNVVYAYSSSSESFGGYGADSGGR